MSDYTPLVVKKQHNQGKKVKIRTRVVLKQQSGVRSAQNDARLLNLRHNPGHIEQSLQAISD